MGFFFFLFIFVFSWAGEMEDAASSASSQENLINNITNREGLLKNMAPFTQPSSSVKSLDGSNSVSVSLKCSSSVNFLEVTYYPVGGGNINALFKEDLDFDGSYDYTYAVYSVAGICDTGLLFCDPGTLDNCQYSAYVVDSEGRLSLSTPVPFDPKMNNTGVACYCINSACGSMSTNPEGVSKVLDDLSGVALSLISSVKDIAGVSVEKDIQNFRVVVSASNPESCYLLSSNGSSSSTRSLYEEGSDLKIRGETEKILSGEKDYPIDGATPDFPKAYEFAKTNPYVTQNPPPSEKYCSIITDGKVKLVSDGGCDFNYTCSGLEDNGDGTFKCYLPYTGSNGCGPVFNYQICGKYHTWTSICDDACVVVRENGTAVWNPMCYKSDGTNSYSGSYDGDTGNTLTSVYASYKDLGGCGCPPYASSGFYVYVRDFPDYTVSNNCGVIEMSGDNCTLDTEVICEPNAVCTDFDSCLKNIDCVVTVEGGAKTGKSVQNTCKFLDGALTGTVLCMNGDSVTTADGKVLETGKDLWWKVFRKFTCTNDQQYAYTVDLSKQKKSIDSTQFDESTGEFSYLDLEANQRTGVIKNYSPDCQKYCRIRVMAGGSTGTYREGELIAPATGQSQSTVGEKGDVMYITYRKCSGDICPIKGNEEQLTSCACMAYQPADWEGLTSLSAVYEATKDIICSSSPP